MTQPPQPQSTTLGRNSSLLARTVSLKSMQRRSSVSALDSVMSDLSFKRWHKRMQARHESLGETGFRLWKWCNKGCYPCRWFDSIPYEAHICKCCFKFKTFKLIGTFFLVVLFTYLFMFALLGDELLPGGTIFFMFLLFVVAYLAGYILLFAGLPPMIAHILVGMLWGNLPESWLPSYDKHRLEVISYAVEKVALIIAIIRAGLLLDMSRIKGHVIFIIQISVVPLVFEAIVVLVASHYLLNLPWYWSALQGSVLTIVSLATITSVMEKNRLHGYGEDKHLSTVLITSSSADVIIGIFFYIICLSLIFPSNGESHVTSIGDVAVTVLEQICVGLITGIVCGLLIAFFPDKRNVEAAAIRILVLGLGAFAVAAMCNRYEMVAGGTLGVIVTCLITSNMWEEMGWHDRNNPVQYFYTMTYYFTQPVALSLVGFSMNFRNTSYKILGKSVAVIVSGLVAREILCYLTTFSRTYPTTHKEKIFICIAWFSKGTFQALLAFAAENMVEQQKSYMTNNTIVAYMANTKIVKETTVLAILLATPLACYGMAILTPILLHKSPVPESRHTHHEASGLQSHNV